MQECPDLEGGQDTRLFSGKATPSLGVCTYRSWRWGVSGGDVRTWHPSFLSLDSRGCFCLSLSSPP